MTFSDEEERIPTYPYATPGNALTSNHASAAGRVSKKTKKADLRDVTRRLQKQ
jgi:hypothetical protein